jgi:hypothetical protein
VATRVGACRSIPCDGHGFATILVTKTFARRSRGSALANAGERGGFYAVGFQMSRNSRNKNPPRTTIFRGSNTQLSVL